MEHVYSPREEADNHLVSFSFLKKTKKQQQKSVNLVICCKVFPSNDCTVFPIQAHRRPNLTLLQNRSRSNQAHNLYRVSNVPCEVSRSYDYWRRLLNVLAKYGHGGHLGHVTKTIFTKFEFSLPREASHKIWH